jgi:hypothetical protein
MQSALAILVLVTAITLAMGSVLFFLAMWQRHQRRLFVSNRLVVSDEAFLGGRSRQASYASLILAGRNALAELCGIPPAMIHDDENLAALSDLMFDGFDAVQFVMEVETRTGTSFGPDADAGLQPFGNHRTVRQWLEHAALHLDGSTRNVVRPSLEN